MATSSCTIIWPRKPGIRSMWPVPSSAQPPGGAQRDRDVDAARGHRVACGSCRPARRSAAARPAPWSCAASSRTVPLQVWRIERRLASTPRPRTSRCRRWWPPTGTGGEGGGGAGAAGVRRDRRGLFARAQIRSRMISWPEAAALAKTASWSVTELTSPDSRAPVFASTSQAISASRFGVPGRSSIRPLDR